MTAGFAAPMNDRHLVLKRARDTLKVAQQALGDARDPARRLAALRNVIVFGRSVTNIIENLRSRVANFDEWYKPLTDEMSKDPLLKYFYTLRSEILKEGKLETGSYAKINIISTDMLMQMPKPPNTVGFFLGDEQGGAGWEVEVSPGVRQKFYVELPENIAVTGLTLTGAPVSEGEDRDALKLCERYLAHMEQVVRQAEQRWG